MMIGATQSVQRGMEATSRPVAANQDSDYADAGSSAANVALYYSPKVRFDSEANVAVLEFRNVATGEMERSIPTKAQLEAYEKAAKIAREEEADKRLQALLGTHPDGAEAGQDKPAHTAADRPGMGGTGIVAGGAPAAANGPAREAAATFAGGSAPGSGEPPTSSLAASANLSA